MPFESPKTGSETSEPKTEEKLKPVDYIKPREEKSLPKPEPVVGAIKTPEKSLFEKGAEIGIKNEGGEWKISKVRKDGRFEVEREGIDGKRIKRTVGREEIYGGDLPAGEKNLEIEDAGGEAGIKAEVAPPEKKPESASDVFAIDGEEIGEKVKKMWEELANTDPEKGRVYGYSKEVIKGKIEKYEEGLLRIAEERRKKSSPKPPKGSPGLTVENPETVESKPVVKATKKSEEAPVKPVAGSPGKSDAFWKEHFEKREEKEKSPRALTVDEKRDVYNMLTGEEIDGKVPKKFEIPEKVHRAAADFFDARAVNLKYYKESREAEKEYDKSGGEKGGAKIKETARFLKNAEKTCTEKLEKYKQRLLAEKYQIKYREFPERFKTVEERREEFEDAKASLVPAVAEYVDKKMESMKLGAEMKLEEKTRERGFVGKLWDRYKNTSKFNKVLISTGLAAGVGAGVALGAGFGLAAATGIAGARAARAFGGGALGAGFNMIGQKIFGVDAAREKRRALDSATEKDREDTRAIFKKLDEMSSKERKGGGMEFYKSLDENATGYFENLKGIDAKDAKRRGWIMLASGLAGGLTAAGVDQYLQYQAQAGDTALATADRAYDINVKRMAAIAAAERAAASAPTGGGAPLLPDADMASNTKAYTKALHDYAAATDPEIKKQIAEVMGKTTEQLDAELPANYTETVKSGDSIWKLANNQLAEHYGDKFNDLSEAQRTHLIDAIKDKVAEDPAKFGLTDPDKLAVGQKVDFSEIFKDQKLMEGAFDKTVALTDAQAAQILENNEQITAWHAAHPHEALTGDKVAEILGGQADASSVLPPTEEIMQVPADVDAPVPVEAVGDLPATAGVQETIMQHIADGNFNDVPPETMAHVEAVKLGHLQDIYGAEKVSGWFSSGANKYWQGWEAIKDLSAQKIIDASGPTDPAFGAPKFGDSTELGNRIELRDYLRGLSSAIMSHSGESVDEFIKRGEIVKTVKTFIGGHADAVSLPKQWE